MGYKDEETFNPNKKPVWEKEADTMPVAPTYGMEETPIWEKDADVMPSFDQKGLSPRVPSNLTPDVLTNTAPVTLPEMPARPEQPGLTPEEQIPQGGISVYDRNPIKLLTQEQNLYNSKLQHLDGMKPKRRQLPKIPPALNLFRLLVDAYTAKPEWLSYILYERPALERKEDARYQAEAAKYEMAKPQIEDKKLEMTLNRANALQSRLKAVGVKARQIQSARREIMNLRTRQVEQTKIHEKRKAEGETTGVEETPRQVEADANEIARLQGIIDQYANVNTEYDTVNSYLKRMGYSNPNLDDGITLPTTQEEIGIKDEAEALKAELLSGNE